MATTPTRRSTWRRVREAPARFIGRTPWLRRRSARRILKAIDRYQEKGRPLPAHLSRLERQLRRVPKPKRQQLVEQMMEMGSSGDDVNTNRELRRASERQERQKGHRRGGLRPGTLPGQARQRPRN